jgi:hypothetical protein
MKNIFVLPTDKPSRLAFDIDDNFYLLCEEPVFFKHQELVENRSIYITSSEKIKEGDWYLDTFKNEIRKAQLDLFNDTYKKIILTTDQKLIEDGIQAIDNEFLRWFKKNPTCECVEIDKGYRGVDLFNYQIIIPQEGYICPHTKIQCDDECCVSAEDCHIPSSLASGIVDCEEPNQNQDPCNLCGKTLREQMKGCYEITCHRQFLNKQETLEEAAYRLSAEKFEPKHIGFMLGVIEGSKWKAERMYSEEEVFSILDNVFHMYASNHRKDAKEWFEQFKKKQHGRI